MSPPAYVKPFVKRQKNDMADGTMLRVAEDATGMPDIHISKVVHTTCNAPRSFITTSSCHSCLPRRFDGRSALL